MSLPLIVAIPLYLVWYHVLGWFLEPPGKIPEDGSADWPTSGPVGRGGQRLLILSFTLSGLLTLLNPLQALQGIRQAIGNVRAGFRLRHVGAEGRESTLTYRLPFDGEWFIYNGGVTPETSHSWALQCQRYAYDFVVADRARVRHTGRGTLLSDYACYGRPIYAAADGEVVHVEGKLRDAPFVGYGLVDFLSRSFLGNHVVIRHTEGEYSFSAHLAPGSLTVAVGDHVSAGQQIGACGHSGHSSEPHLHFHLQDRADFFTAGGIRIRFRDLRVDGVELPESTPSRGTWVEPVGSGV